MKNRGFTLIELLVVISIISLLSTVVMASLNQSRKKAQIAGIKSDLQSIKTQAEISYSKTGDYSTVEADIAPILMHINSNGGTAAFVSSNFSLINEGYKRYAVSVKLNSDTTKNWSVSDSYNIVTWDTMDPNPIATKRSWSISKTDCKNSGGRLPTIEELKSLYDSGINAPSNYLNSEFYWSENQTANPSFAYVVNMSSGFLTGQSTAITYRRRCVR